MSDAYHCYPCARGTHAEHKDAAWEPDIPCECPCTIPYQHGPHVVDDGRLQVRCPGGVDCASRGRASA